MAGACGGSGSDSVAAPAATEVPTPTVEPPPPSPEPAPQAEPPAPPEPAPPAVAPSEPPPAAAEAPPVEEPDPPAPAEEPETATDPPEAPAAAVEPSEVAGDELDEAAVTALAERLAAAQASTTSTQMRVYMSVAASFPDEPPVTMEDVPFMTLTEVGDLARAEMDMAGFVAGMFGAADPGTEMPDLPTLEMILEGETGFYLKLESLAALDPGDPSPWPEDLLAEHGGDIGELWGFVDLTSATAAEILAPLGVTPQTALQDDLVDLLAGSLPEGALLEARMGGATDVAGTPTRQYSFVLDLVALSELPDSLGMLLGPDPGGLGAPEGDPLGGLGGPLPVEYVVHVDSDDLVRRIVVVVDIGAMLTQVFDALAADEGLPEGADAVLPEFEYVMSMRMDVVAHNDPSLAVELPDPSVVVDLADFLIGAEVF